MMSLLVEKNISLSERNTLGVVSHADFYCVCKSEEDILAAMDWSKRYSQVIFVLAGGSNCLLPERVEGLVVHIAILGKNIDERDVTRVSVGAGEHWDEFVQWSLQQGLYGLENLSLIPGSVGASPIQNIGAYGVEVGSFIETVKALNIHTGERVQFSTEQCKFAYRESFFKSNVGREFIITEVVFKLERTSKVNISYPALNDHFRARMDDGELSPELVARAVIEIRRAKLPDPKALPNVGSFFKNPVVDSGRWLSLKAEYPNIVGFKLEDGNTKLAAAWLIDKAGWKRASVGGLRMHDQQALVLINADHQALDDVLAFAESVSKDILMKFAVQLDIEPQVLQSLGFGR